MKKAIHNIICYTMAAMTVVAFIVFLVTITTVHTDSIAFSAISLLISGGWLVFYGTLKGAFVW